MHNKKNSYLNRFRGEPAITIFDWPFTPKHTLSQNIATFKGSFIKTTHV